MGFALRHAANSAGLIQHPESHLDMVRGGIALYGLGSSALREIVKGEASGWSYVRVAMAAMAILPGTGCWWYSSAALRSAALFSSWFGMTWALLGAPVVRQPAPGEAHATAAGNRSCG